MNESSFLQSEAVMSKVKILVGVGCAYLTAGCSVSTNLNQLFASKAQRNAYDNAMAKAQALYDKGKYEDAEDYGEIAYGINPRNDDAAVLLGFIRMGIAGIEPFQLARNMISSSEEKKESEGANLAEKETSDVLTSMSAILGFSGADLAKLGESNESEVFADYPLIIPSCADDARASLYELGKLANAISVVCPFVSHGTEEGKESVVLDKEDSRYKDCEPSPFASALSTKAHFLWAFTHLSEALAFNSILLYKSETNYTGKSNLEARADALKAMKPDSLSALANFSEGVAELEDNISSIFPLGGTTACGDKGTQLQAVLTDLLAVNAAFGLIPGVPESMTKTISAKISAIEKARGSSTGADASAAQEQKLKGDLTKKMAEGVYAGIEGIDDETLAKASPQEIQTICSNYDKLAEGLGSARKTPAACASR